MSGAAGDGVRSAHEKVDVVDEGDRVVGTSTRAEMRRSRLRHRAVFVAVLEPAAVGDRHRLLVHRRSMDKDVWPGRWDVAVGGVVASGEGYDAAAAREIAEELGIASAQPVAVGDGRYCDEDVDLIGRCYVLVHPGPFEFADGEVVEARWVDAAELSTMEAEPSMLVPDSVALVLPLIEPLLR